MITVSVLSKNIKNKSKSFGIRYNGSQLKACLGDYSGFFHRFMSSPSNYHYQDRNAVKVRLESSNYCNGVKVKFHENGWPSPMPGGDAYLSQRYDMVWRYTTNKELCWILVDCYFKNTNANPGYVSVFFTVVP